MGGTEEQPSRLTLQIAAWGGILLGLYLASLHSYLLFHSLVEIVGIGIAVGIFLIAWNARRFLDNDCLLFIGLALPFIAGLDLLHTLAYKGMGIFPGANADPATQLWIAGRYLQSATLALAPTFLRRRLRTGLTGLACSLLTAAVLLAIFVWDVFPDCYLEGRGLTRFKVESEYAICLLFALAVFRLLRNREAFASPVLAWIVWSLGLNILAELFFTVYVSVYGFANLAGHYLRLVAAYLLYKAIIETGLREPYALLFRSLKRSQEDLARSRDELEGRVQERTAELGVANEELARHRDRLRALSAQAMTAREEEARRIARELHDEVGQSLTSLLFRLRGIEGMRSVPEGRQMAAELRPLVAQTLEEVHNLIKAIRPGALEELGLAAALDRYIRGYAVATELRADFCAPGLQGDRFPAEVETALFRIGQEALTNIAKHARARTVSVTLTRDERGLRLVVEDDGCGFDPAATCRRRVEPGGLGLVGMEERAALLGGALAIESRPNSGTTVVVTIPLSLLEAAHGQDPRPTR